MYFLKHILLNWFLQYIYQVTEVYKFWKQPKRSSKKFPSFFTELKGDRTQGEEAGGGGRGRGELLLRHRRIQQKLSIRTKMKKKKNYILFFFWLLNFHLFFSFLFFKQNFTYYYGITGNTMPKWWFFFLLNICWICSITVVLTDDYPLICHHFHIHFSSSIIVKSK